MNIIEMIIGFTCVLLFFIVMDLLFNKELFKDKEKTKFIIISTLNVYTTVVLGMLLTFVLINM